MINVFLDDIRPSPPGFELVRTAEHAIDMLKYEKVNVLSLDYNLSTKPITGYDVVKYMVETSTYPKKIIIHSANPIGSHKMTKLLLQHKPIAVKLSIFPLLWL